MRRIVVFLKYPEPGQVKTRLAADVGPGAAARLARHFAEATLAAAGSLGLPVDISYSPEERGPEFRTWLGPGRACSPQQGADLGQRMRHAFSEAFARGAARVALVGTDAPDRPVEFYAEALERLDDHDVVLGPSLDGGYHCIAFRRDGFAPEAFQDIAWSTPRVLIQTLDALRRAGRSVWTLPPWPDIDDRAGLDDYLERNPEARRLLEETDNMEEGQACRAKD